MKLEKLNPSHVMAYACCQCGAIRTPGSKASPKCELPKGSHMHGPDNQHFGRSRSGNWYSWVDKTD